MATVCSAPEQGEGPSPIWRLARGACSLSIGRRWRRFLTASSGALNNLGERASERVWPPPLVAPEAQFNSRPRSSTLSWARSVGRPAARRPHLEIINIIAFLAQGARRPENTRRLANFRLLPLVSRVNQAQLGAHYYLYQHRAALAGGRMILIKSGNEGAPSGVRSF